MTRATNAGATTFAPNVLDDALAVTGDRLGRADLVDALADGSTLETASWWRRAVDPGLRRLVGCQVGDTGICGTPAG
ncbi:hypothetical protein [Halorubrum halophilum]|uniref:hypothetical protein n=1 Tax=Halorubrum halophilum TaxID=413816 RepID=UPI0006799965|nr:hypothetical protein [Halorubrum halophilum]